ncbi:uracil-DNA glycosylase [SAR202 cluster bacterium AD-804-J14_MRT_500m]|nr:uracil-DNA glycosylase [SAR202 cluster bacterium AD-804-J14_MRT_500m]
MTSLEKLQNEIVNCTLCPRLVNHCRTTAAKKRRMYMDWEYWGKPVPSFGDPDARVLILGLAPAAHGGNRTGRMFTGDKSGDWVYGALHKFGFASQPESTHRGDGQTLTDAYITAPLHCAPPLNKPFPQEMANCQPYLVKELRLLKNVEVLVALGNIAFKNYFSARRSMGLAVPSPALPFGHNLSHKLSKDLTIVSSYHPSQQNTQTGRLTREMFDNVFVTVRKILNKNPNAENNL